MSILFENLKFSQFEIFSELIHAVSPRCFKNDQGEINLNELSIIGVGLGASVATIWAAHDWAYPPLAVGKQGQDVKALVLVSPRWKNNGLLIQKAVQQRDVQREIALIMMLLKF